MRADDNSIESLKDDANIENDGNMLGIHSVEHLAGAMNGDREEEELDSRFPEKEGSVFYFGKNVTACDLPKIVVCYKENTYHVVKDICVDEDSCKWIPDQSGSEDRTKAEVTGILESKSSDISPVKAEAEEHYSEFCNDSESGSEISTTQHIKDAADVQVSSTGNYADADAEESRKCDEENSIATGEFKDDGNCNIAKDMPALDAFEISPKIDPEKHICTRGSESENLSSREEVGSTKESLTLADIISMEDGKNPLNDDRGRLEEQSYQESNGKKSSESETEDSKAADESSSPVTVSGEASEAEKASSGEENSGHGKNADVSDVSSVSTFRESIKATGPSTASRGESETEARTNESQRLEPENHAPRHSCAHVDSNDHPFSSHHFPSGFGETSFSAAEPVSGLITYCGPIAFSGSLSVRSDGSTGSTRSFAFPVLQSEWSSSPVRMAKADKRHLRRQKSWKHTLCCCRF